MLLERTERLHGLFGEGHVDDFRDVDLRFDEPLLRVEVEKAEYWDSPSSAVVRLFGFAKALATGKRYGEEGTDHEKISL